MAKPRKRDTREGSLALLEMSVKNLRAHMEAEDFKERPDWMAYLLRLEERASSIRSAEESRPPEEFNPAMIMLAKEGIDLHLSEIDISMAMEKALREGRLDDVDVCMHTLAGVRYGRHGRRIVDPIGPETPGSFRTSREENLAAAVAWFNGRKA